MRIKIGIITLLITGLMVLTAGLVSAQETISVSGTVKDATNGVGIEGAVVQVDGADPAISTNTVALGAYTIDGVPIGEQSITVSVEGYISGNVTADFAATGGTPVDFALQPVVEEAEDPGPNTVSGTVSDGTDAGAIEGALVQVDGSDPVLSAITDSSGAYSIGGVTAGTQNISASAEGYDGETIGVEVSDTEGVTANFTLQPTTVGEEEEEADEQEEDDGGKEAGDRKGHVGVFVSGADSGSFVVTTKKGDMEIQVLDGDLESITRRPGQPAGIPEDGDRVAVLVEFVDQGGIELAQVARQIIVKPTPQKPIVGAVVTVTTDEDGVRTLTIMRPNGTTKDVRLGSKDELPVVGDLVTAFQGRSQDDDGEGEQGGPPVAKGLVRAQEVRERLEGFLDDLTSDEGELSSDEADSRARRVAKLAEKLEKHAAKHTDIIERVSANENLPSQAVAGMQNGLERAQRGRDQAKVKATEAKTKAGRPSDPGNQGKNNKDDTEEQGGSDNQGRSGDKGNSSNNGNSSDRGAPDDKGNSGNQGASSNQGNSGSNGNSGNQGRRL